MCVSAGFPPIPHPSLGPNLPPPPPPAPPPPSFASSQAASELESSASANAAFCAFATWRAARLYAADSFNYWDAGPALNTATHAAYAQTLYVAHLVTVSQAMSPEAAAVGYDDTAFFAMENLQCSQAVQRLSCLQVRVCVYMSSSSSSLSLSLSLSLHTH